MADPAALALQVGVLIKNLIEYGHEMKGAQDQITSLWRELASLRGILEDIKAQRPNELIDNGISDCLANARSVTDHLLHRIQPSSSRLQRAKQIWLWPLRQKELEQILARLGRINMSIIMILMGGQQSISLDMQALKDELRGVADMISTEFHSQNQKRIISALAPVSPELAHDDACSVWAGTDSGTWFVDMLQPWLHCHCPEKRVLALYGSSGTGKTTIISKAIEHLNSTLTRGKLGYFYCKFNDEASQSVRNVLGSWLAQIASHKPSIIDRYAEVQSGKQRLPVSWWEDALVQTTVEVGPIVLVLDAVNESEDEQQLRDCMTRLAKRCEDIRFVVSSTPFPDDRFSAECIGIDMSLEEVKSDIEQYVRRVVRGSSLLVQAGEESIVDAVVPQAMGMFRWAECQMSLLSGCLTAKIVRQWLTELPGTLDSTYIEILRRLPTTTRPWVREILMWLCYAYRPLTLAEVAEAIVIEPGQSSIDDDCRLQPQETVLRLCKGLVTYNANTNTVSLAHSSVRTTLESRTIRESEVAEFGMSRDECTPSIISKSLTYLLMEDFNRQLCACEQIESCPCFDRYPFLNYAGTMWAVHANMHLRRGNKFRESELRQVLALLGTHGSGYHFALWIRIIVDGFMMETIQRATPLYYAASFGLKPVVEIMLSHALVTLDDPRISSHIDWKSGRNSSTPLGVAVFRGQIDVAELLLRCGARPNTTDIFGNSPLDYAVLNRDQSMIGLLRQNGAEGPTDSDTVKNLMTSRGFVLPWSQGSDASREETESSEDEECWWRDSQVLILPSEVKDKHLVSLMSDRAIRQQRKGPGSLDSPRKLQWLDNHSQLQAISSQTTPPKLSEQHFGDPPASLQEARTASAELASLARGVNPQGC
ncbi:hypothetical protein BST61_g10628 [Cercospora zeina]